MKNQQENNRKSERELVYWGYQSRSLRYDISHERFVVPWQMDSKEKKVKVE